MNAREKILFCLLVGVQLFLISLFDDAILFWDTVQFAGKQATYFFNNGFDNGLILPQGIDSGHPPFFAIYISFIWKLFGKSLLSTHWAMFPFLMAINYQSVKLGHTLMPRMYWLFPVLLFVCPYYLGHSILVSPDLVLVLGFLMALRGIIDNRSISLSIGILLMCMISTRGVAIAGALFLYDFYTNGWRGWKHVSTSDLITIKPYLLGGLVFMLFNIYHYTQTSWIGYHAESSWAPSFATIELKSLPRNIVVFLWKFLDYGMVICAMLILYRIRFLFIMRGRFIWLLIALISVLFVITVPYQGLLNHRYFLPVVIILLLISAQLLHAMNNKWVTGLCIFIIATGNLWIYPPRISQGWDSTLAHVPFYSLEMEVGQFVVEHEILIEEIGTAFPIRTPRKYLDLNNSEKGYKEYNLQSDTYILYSNVMNEFSDEEMNQLSKEWEVIFNKKRGGITMTLFKNKNWEE